MRVEDELLLAKNTPPRDENGNIIELRGEQEKIDNILIFNRVWAENVANHIFNELNLRHNYSAEIRDGVALEPCDNISAEVRCFDRDRQGTNDLNTKPAFIAKKALSFDGSLRSDLEYTLKRLPTAVNTIPQG